MRFTRKCADINGHRCVKSSCVTACVMRFIGAGCTDAAVTKIETRNVGTRASKTRWGKSMAVRYNKFHPFSRSLAFHFVTGGKEKRTDEERRTIKPRERISQEARRNFFLVKNKYRKHVTKTEIKKEREEKRELSVGGDFCRER